MKIGIQRMIINLQYSSVHAHYGSTDYSIVNLCATVILTKNVVKKVEKHLFVQELSKKIVAYIDVLC